MFVTVRSSFRSSFQASLVRFLRDDEGVTLVEYALLIGLIAVAAIAAVTAIGTNTNNKLNSAANALK